MPGRFCIESRGESGVARRNLVFGPSTFTTGCSPIVLVTTPPQPASKARMMFASDSVGGADDRRNGFSNRKPVKVTASVGAMCASDSKHLSLVVPGFRVPKFRGSQEPGSEVLRNQNSEPGF